jgi:UDP-N-acetylmuramoyl-L-alanyl-D-glutamate--2,6-diaminopimelate ligase
MTKLGLTLPATAEVSLLDVGLALAAFAPRLEGDGAVRVAGVRQDSRSIEPGDLFVARPGERSNGLNFVPEALKRGAAALLVEHGTDARVFGVPVLEVRDVRRAIGFAAERVYGRPSKKLALVGITGTNGKTTTSVLLEHALTALGARTARLGTLGFSFENERTDGQLTTPEADDISRLIASVAGAGGTHFVMEVSSHALSLARVDALQFRVAAFTNLTQDHLDFYASMAEYGAAKARLFAELSPGASVIATDAEFGNDLARRAKGRVLTTGRVSTASVRPVSATLDALGVHADVTTPSGDARLESRLVGEHNLENLLTALGVLVELGYAPGDAARALGSAPPVPGRLERCDDDADDIRVLVDYAHTPDALARVLAAVHAITRGELSCVFGCGGDRDPGKRPQMGAAVGRGAERAILTSDNPRSEDPAAIAAQVEAGLRGESARYEIELDRARAIERAVLEARAGDSVLIAGKGHEPYQIVGTERRAFDDRVEARRALALRRAKGASA